MPPSGPGRDSLTHSAKDETATPDQAREVTPVHSPVQSRHTGRLLGGRTTCCERETAPDTSRLGRRERSKAGLLDATVTPTTIGVADRFGCSGRKQYDTLSLVSRYRTIACLWSRYFTVWPNAELRSGPSRCACGRPHYIGQRKPRTRNHPASRRYLALLSCPG